MRTFTRFLVILGIAATLGLSVSLPAFAGMTKCLCNNGETIDTSRKGDRGCNSACKILGGGGRVWTPEDENDGGDTVVVPPARKRRGGPRR